MLQSIASWLGDTALSLVLQTVSWAIPTLQSIHILALAGVMVAAWLMGLRLMGFRVSTQSPQRLARRMLPWLWIAVAVLAVSGGLLVVAEPSELLFNRVFQLKMLLLAIALAITVLLQRIVGKASIPDGDVAAISAPGVRVLAFASLVLWVAIIFCGRLIAYIL